jgi:hypothetical protein
MNWPGEHQLIRKASSSNLYCLVWRLILRRNYLKYLAIPVVIIAALLLQETRCNYHERLPSGRLWEWLFTAGTFSFAFEYGLQCAQNTTLYWYTVSGTENASINYAVDSNEPSKQSYPIVSRLSDLLTIYILLLFTANDVRSVDYQLNVNCSTIRMSSCWIIRYTGKERWNYQEHNRTAGTRITARGCGSGKSGLEQRRKL